ncbi:AAA family ATPase [Halalkalirubrum salinum]|uniref:AAA family ATPase n=1 Tax=Halalkalirubrum salinum TaxID=2563889 RepID=UPI0010FB9035|nr:AAA family ATPase [Halalkalirubrum salinum]
MRVVGTVGLPGSGKGEIAAVAAEHDIPVITMGDVIRQACRDRGLDPTEHHGEMAQTLREENGPAAVAERSLPMIEAAIDAHEAETVLVDGLRSLVEVETFEAAFGDAFTLVSVEAPFDLRAERLADRGRDASDSDLEALRARDARELELGVGEVMDRADVTIENTDTLEAFHDRAEAVLFGEPAKTAGQTGEEQ